jgi:hypothetical protein
MITIDLPIRNSGTKIKRMITGSLDKVRKRRKKGKEGKKKQRGKKSKGEKI